MSDPEGAGEVGRPDREGCALFFSVGLAGTEAFLLARLATQLDSTGRAPAR